MKQFFRKREQQLWTKYLALRTRGLKKESVILLNQLIIGLQKYSFKDMNKIVIYLCEIQSTNDIRIDYLLFTKLIYPNLMENIEKSIPDYLRLLATFEQIIYSDIRLSKETSKRLNLKTNFFDTIEVLEKELLIGKNLKAAKLLINKIAWQLDYAVHELPTRIIYKSELMNHLLSRLVSLLNEYGMIKKIWNQRIKFIETAINHWNIYLKTNEFENFEQYLKTLNSSDAAQLLECKIPLYDIEE